MWSSPGAASVYSSAAISDAGPWASESPRTSGGARRERAQDACQHGAAKPRFDRSVVDRLPSAPQREIPRYIRACSANPDPLKPQGSFWVYDKDQPGRVTRVPYTCRSWRCPWPGGCAEHESHVLYTRLEEAFGEAPPQEMVFIVLTLDADFHRMATRGDAAVNLKKTYQQLGQRAYYFRRRLRRLLEDWGLPWFENRWINVVEQHESGVPHINFVVHSPELAAFVERRRRERRRQGRTKATAKLIASIDGKRDSIDEQLHTALTECGFGYRSSWEQVHDRSKVLSYSNAVAKHADATATRMDGRLRAAAARGSRRRHRSSAGEVAKKSQLPVAAPKGFRRVRSGIKFIPPRHKGDKSGTVLMRFQTREGDEIVRPLVKSNDPLHQSMTALCTALEQQESWNDEDRRARQLQLETLLAAEAHELGRKKAEGHAETRDDRENFAQLVAAHRRSMTFAQRTAEGRVAATYRIDDETLKAYGVVPRAGPGEAGTGPPATSETVN